MSEVNEDKNLQERHLAVGFGYRVLNPGPGFPFQAHKAIAEIGFFFSKNLQRVWSVDLVLSAVVQKAFNVGRESAGEPHDISLKFGDWRTSGAHKDYYTSEIIAKANYHGDSERLIVSSQLVGLWTAFELLATDLWVEAVNASPSILGKNAFLAKPKPPEDAPDPTAERAANESTKGSDKKQFVPSVPFHLLEGMKFDLSKSMGIYLKTRTRKFDFNRLSGMHAAYAGAFDGYADATTFEGVFRDRSDYGMRSLEICRNVVLHRAGVLDERFESQAKDIAGLASLKAGDPLPITRNHLLAFNNEVIEQGVALARFVNDWLFSHHPE